MNKKGFETLPIDFKQIADMDLGQYTYFKHLKNRILILNQNIDEDTLEKFTMRILEWNIEDMGLPKQNRKPIKIYVNSLGGCVADGMMLVDVIKNSTTPVYTVVTALAYSMGCLIAVAGHKRYAFENSTLLLHDGTQGAVTSSAKFKDVSRFYDELEARTKNFVLNNTKMDESLYDEKYGNEFYMYADKAKELAFIDFIIGEDITLDAFLKL